jgi:hypothetical protein
VKRTDAMLAGIATGAASSVLGYALVRGMERVLFTEPNPAGLIWADHSPFEWRAYIAVYIGGGAAFGGFALARRAKAADEAAAERWLFALVALSAFAIVVQGALLP